MKKTTQILSLALMVLFLATSAQAALLGTIAHDYGKGLSKVDPGGDDRIYNDYVKVRDGNHARFHDTFDLSGLNIGSVDNFKLTLTFSNTSTWFEDWRVRVGGGTEMLPLDHTYKKKIQQTFTIDSSFSKFASMVANKSFVLWFAEEGLFPNRFKLYDAKLEVNGTAATPIPGAVWLLGTGLVGLVGLRRRKA